MARRILQMKSSRLTVKEFRHQQTTWKYLVAQNEISLLRVHKVHRFPERAYKKAEKNSWIVKTLMDKKERYKFKTCKNLVMIGSGIYPYSMFDVHKQYPHIKQIGLEIVPARAKLSKKLIDASPANNDIEILCMDAIDYDYSWLDMDDLIFISVDVDSKKIAEKIIETSKAHLYTCAPYENTWLKNTVMMTASDYLALE